MNNQISEEDFLDLQGDNIVPIRYNIDTQISPVNAYEALREYDDTGYSFLLESGETQSLTQSEMTDRGRNSYIGFNPSAVVSVGDGKAEIKPLRTENHGLSFDQTVENGKILENYDPLDVLRDVNDDTELNRLPTENNSFEGGLVGYHPYELVYDTKPVEKPDAEIPQSVFVFADRFISFDHKTGENNLVYIPSADLEPSAQYQSIEEDAARIEEILQGFNTSRDYSTSIEFMSSGDKADFKQSVEDVNKDVENGEIYQGVISRKKKFEIDGDPLDIYSDLKKRNPSPYMYFLDFEEKGILGASPETLTRTDDKMVETNPIAGTIQRGKSLMEDKKYEGELLADEKERSEHAMLVDLGRNDVKAVSKPGTTNVDQFMQVIPYSTVQHIESRISGELEEGKDSYDAMRSIFPAGTLTGAPKKRAMEIIRREEHQNRGIYGGAIGYYSLTGEVDSAITIRTMSFDKKDENMFEGVVQAGAGIVADSKPDSEFQETNQKMGSVVESLEAVNRGEEL